MKYELGQLIFYLRDNRLHSAHVLARRCVENGKEDYACTKEQAELLTPFGPAGKVYATCHGEVKEEEAFATKEDLAAALIAFP